MTAEACSYVYKTKQFVLLLNSCVCSPLCISLCYEAFCYPTSNSCLLLFLFLLQLCSVFSTHSLMLSVLLLFIELTIYFLNLVCVLVSQLVWSVDFVVCPLVSQNSSVFSLCASACTNPCDAIPGPDWDVSTSETKCKVEALFMLCPNMAFCLPMSTYTLAYFCSFTTRLKKKRPNILNSAPTSEESALRLLSAPSVRFS
jgi:hypothetical protein